MSALIHHTLSAAGMNGGKNHIMVQRENLHLYLVNTVIHFGKFFNRSLLCSVLVLVHWKLKKHFQHIEIKILVPWIKIDDWSNTFTYQLISDQVVELVKNDTISSLHSVVKIWRKGINEACDLVCVSPPCQFVLLMIFLIFPLSHKINIRDSFLDFITHNPEEKT